MAAKIGHYQLCAAEGIDRAESMFLSPAYQGARGAGGSGGVGVGGWSWLRRQVADAKLKLEAAGGVLSFVVVKYFAGQGCTRDVQGRPVAAEPMALDLLEARDRGVATGVIGPGVRQGRAGMEIFSAYCLRVGIMPIAYIGKAPDVDRLAELRTNDADVEFVTGWFNAMAGLGWRFIMDSTNMPEHHDESVAFVRFLAERGCPMEAFDAEAYPLGGGAVAAGTWPNVEWTTCWGENTAWRVSGLPETRGQMRCRAGLLHAGGVASNDVCLAAWHAGYAAMNVNAMEMDDLRMVVEYAGRAPEGNAGDRVVEVGAQRES